MNFVLPGIGAGLVSALLTAVIVKATPLAAVLYLLSPIPVLIVSLGWNHRSGLVAAAVGGVAIALAISPLSGLGFALVTALPAWWLAYLALLGRPSENGTMEWYPLGRLLAWVAATAALTVVAAGIVSTRGSYEAFLGNAREIAELFVNLQFPKGQPDSLDDATRKELVELFARITPFLSAQGFTVVLALYLWAAAKIVALSKRLPRPWSPVPELAMPRAAAALLVACMVVAMLGLENFVGVFAAALAGGLFMAFALQGLAAVHDRTRGNAVRGFILSALYVVLFLSQGILMVALSLFGLADTLFGLRRRFGGGGGPKLPQTPSP
ncbi:DUF2232 domain-containing protein [Microvirga thermotolerans]|uniref:DUF2232 domain-containing protein n=1 Tax=Microvirga thermotolerans TaxID=2651334 RepID=A0A5P9JWL9_9HYPH|nr:DUF2232 domain-containing protein [Microvirga thermotolerans]QFU16619.1 DUF2232 domain-containing protein [Microvirga thermotolerans]